MNILKAISQFLHSLLSRVHLVRKKDEVTLRITSVQASSGLGYSLKDLNNYLDSLEKAIQAGWPVCEEAKALLQKARSTPSLNKGKKGGCNEDHN